MPRSTRPRKRHTARTINTPMTTPAHRRLALEMRMAVEALIAAPAPDTFNAVSKILAAVDGAGLRGQPLAAATATMNQICDRYERMGLVKVGVSDAEAAALRQHIADVELALPLAPLNVLNNAIAQVEIFCSLEGA